MSNKQPKKKYEQYGQEFYLLATEISHILAKNKEDDTTQKEQVEELWLKQETCSDENVTQNINPRNFIKNIYKVNTSQQPVMCIHLKSSSAKDNGPNKITLYC